MMPANYQSKGFADNVIDLLHLVAMECNALNVVYVTSRLGCLGRPAGANVQTAAASCTGEIPSCLDTHPDFQHQPFQQW